MGDTAATAHDGYDPAYFPRLFAVEDRHFWFQARNELIGTLVGQLVADRPPGYQVLEIGCGTGNVLRVVERTCRHGQVTGMDLFPEALRHARQRVSCTLVQGDLNAQRDPPFRTPFALIGMFDVLEHLAEDTEVLRRVHGMLEDGGRLLLTVPAHQGLWSYFDKACCHCRRYEASELRAKLGAAGFEVEYQTQFMMSLYPLVWLGRRLNAWTARGRGSIDHGTLTARELRVVPGVNRLLRWLLTLENRWITRRRQLPFGTSLLAIARRNGMALSAGKEPLKEGRGHAA